MSTNAGTTDDATDVRIEEGWTNSLTRESFLEHQMKDESLQGLWQSATAGHPRYIIQDGLLYAKDDECEQPELLLVPRQYRKEILELAHDKLIGGHGAGSGLIK